MKTVAMVIVFCITLAIGAAVVDAAEFEIYFGTSYMSWIERTALSRKDPFVEESGWIQSAGGNVLFYPTKNLFSRLGLEVFGGSIDYKGEYISNWTPHEETGNWSGVSLEETLGYKIKINKNLYLSPFISFGLSVWQREICAETWIFAYSRLGIEAEKGKSFLKIGLLFPFHTEVDGGYEGIYWINSGKKTEFKVYPKGVPTPFVEVGIRCNKKFTVSFFYELRKWEKSDNINLGGGAYAFQPETTQSLIGARLEYKF